MEELFKYLHLLNEARSSDKGDMELYNRQQNVCDAIEKTLGIQESKEKPLFFTDEILYVPKSEA